MNKPKAIVSTVLLAVVMAVALGGAKFVRNDELGLNLHNLLLMAVGYIWIGNRLGDFYRWMVKGE